MADTLGSFTSPAAKTRYDDAYDALARHWPLPSTTIEVATPYGPTAVRRSGDGDRTPLVLLHGLNGCGLSWHAVVADLAVDRVVYAPDVVGTAGRSTQTAPLHRPEEFGAWATALLDELGLDRAHVLGYSEGAWFAALAATTSPGRLASLTLGEGITALTRPSLRAVARLMTAGARPTEQRLARLDAWLSPGVVPTPEDRALAQAAMAYRRRTPWPSPLTDDQLERITAPTLAFFGAETVLADPVAAGRRVTTHVPDAEVVLVPGAGHGVLWQLPDQVVPAINAFVARHD
jgi:pimeloyl-ACP methyl ester carboxylesterase